jgi:hypothetical protein
MVSIPILKEFVPRFVIPEKGNKYYNSTSAGGYAVGTILGNPLCNGLNVYANCVGHSASRFNEVVGQGKWVYLHYPPNAEDFIDKAKSEGLEISNKPSLGAIIVFAKGKTHNNADGAGHVENVEKINSDGSIITSSSGYGCAKPFWTTTRRNDGNWSAGSVYRFLGFIKNPAVNSNTMYIEKEIPTGNGLKNPYTESTNLLKEGSVGDDVKWLQWYLVKYGYYKNKISGEFDMYTLASVLAFQKKNGLTIDGIVGQNTKNKLKNY